MDIVREGELLGKDELMAEFAAAGVTPERHITTTCGSGVTAAILSLGLEVIGHKGHSLYDGSWAEWGAKDNAPVAVWK
jgi:thiosulfate/3-mercaptopyruvate sulfurtransferase